MVDRTWLTFAPAPIASRVKAKVWLGPAPGIGFDQAKFRAITDRDCVHGCCQYWRSIGGDEDEMQRLIDFRASFDRNQRAIGRECRAQRRNGVALQNRQWRNSAWGRAFFQASPKRLERDALRHLRG